jgi:hypothetical protein
MFPVDWLIKKVTILEAETAHRTLERAAAIAAPAVGQSASRARCVFSDVRLHFELLQVHRALFSPLCGLVRQLCETTPQLA